MHAANLSRSKISRYLLASGAALFVFLIASSPPVNAQENNANSGGQAAQQAPGENPSGTLPDQPYVLTLTKVILPALDQQLADQLAEGGDLSATIDQLAAENRLIGYEQIRVSIQEGQPVMSQFGQRVPQVSGVQMTSTGRMNTMRIENVGAIVRAELAGITATGRASLRLQYESSRLRQYGDDPTQSGITTLTYENVLTLRVGATQLVNSSQSDETTLLLASLQQSGDFRPRAVQLSHPNIPKLWEDREGEPSAAARSDGRGGGRGFAQRLSPDRDRVLVDRLFPLLDKNRDGELTRDELVVDGTTSVFDYLIDADADRNGTVSEREYQGFAQGQPDVQAFLQRLRPAMFSRSGRAGGEQ